MQTFPDCPKIKCINVIMQPYSLALCFALSIHEKEEKKWV